MSAAVRLGRFELARLVHPHVVTVDEAGVNDDRSHLVMELVAGCNAAAWLAAAPRTLAQRLDVYR